MKYRALNIICLYPSEDIFGASRYCHRRGPGAPLVYRGDRTVSWTEIWHRYRLCRGNRECARSLSTLFDQHLRYRVGGQPGLFSTVLPAKRRSPVFLSACRELFATGDPPLGVSMENLLVRNLVHRSLTIKTQELALADRDVRFSNLSIRMRQGAAFVRADLVAPPGALNQDVVDSIRDSMSELKEMPVVLEFSIIPEKIVRSSDVAMPEIIEGTDL